MKFKKILLIILLNGLFVLGVNAATVEFDNNKTLMINDGASENVTIKITTKDDEKIEKVEFSISYDNSLVSIISNSQETYLQQAAKNASTVLITAPSSDKLISTGEIFSFAVKNDSLEEKTTEIKIANLKINGQNVVDEVKPLTLNLKKEVTTTTRTPNTSAKLTNFSVSNATIKPAFSADTKEYKIYTNKDSIRQVTIRPTYEQSGVSMSVECTLGCTTDAAVPNKLNLVMGKNEATYTFTSEDGKSTEIYKFTIYRGATTDGSNLLASLSIDGVELNEKFDKSNLDYTATVPYETEDIIIKAEAEDENADIKIKGNEGLTVGENVVTITVTSAETTEKKIYNITVTREEFNPDENATTGVSPVIEKQNNKKNIWLIIIIILVSLLIIGTAAYFIFFKKKTKKNKKKKEQDSIEVNEKNFPENTLIDEDKEPTSVDEALADLMKTKEIQKTRELEI